MARLLVAEDDADVLGYIVLALELEGHHVLTARDGEEALLAAGRDEFDLVVLDVMMPKISGLDVVRQLDRAHDGAVPVLLVSGMASCTDVERGIAAGAAGYLTKPFDPDRLLAEVERLAGNGSRMSPDRGRPRATAAPSGLRTRNSKPNRAATQLS